MKLIQIMLIFVVDLYPSAANRRTVKTCRYEICPESLLAPATQISWQKAPPEIDPKLSAGSASAFCFGPDGTLKYWSGTVYKKDGLIKVSAGDAESR